MMTPAGEMLIEMLRIVRKMSKPKVILTPAVIAHLVYEHLCRDEQDEVLEALQRNPEHFATVANNEEAMRHEMSEVDLAQAMLRIARKSLAGQC